MTTITAPDGRQLDTRPLHHQARVLGGVGVAGIDPRWDVRAVITDTDRVVLRLGPVSIHADGGTTAAQVEHLREIMQAALGALAEAERDPLDALTDEAAS